MRIGCTSSRILVHGRADNGLAHPEAVVLRRRGNWISWGNSVRRMWLLAICDEANGCSVVGRRQFPDENCVGDFRDDVGNSCGGRPKTRSLPRSDLPRRGVLGVHVFDGMGELRAGCFFG